MIQNLRDINIAEFVVLICVAPYAALLFFFSAISPFLGFIWFFAGLAIIAYVAGYLSGHFGAHVPYTREDKLLRQQLQPLFGDSMRFRVRIGGLTGAGVIVGRSAVNNSEIVILQDLGIRRPYRKKNPFEINKQRESQINSLHSMGYRVIAFRYQMPELTIKTNKDLLVFENLPAVERLSDEELSAVYQTLYLRVRDWIEPHNNSYSSLKTSEREENYGD